MIGRSGMILASPPMKPWIGILPAIRLAGVKGTLIPFIADTIAGRDIREAVLHWKWLPMFIRIAKGTRNLIDAAVQSQQRTAARLRLNPNASRDMAPAKRVDCHRWL